MTDDLTFEELPPGRYNGTVEKIRYSFKAATHIVITYKLDTPDGRSAASSRGSPSVLRPRRLFTSRRRWARVGWKASCGPRDCRSPTLKAAGGIRALPGLLEGSAICVVTRNRWVAGFNCPVVDRIEA